MYYGFQFSNSNPRTTRPMDEYGQRVGYYHRFKHKVDVHAWVKKSKYRIYVPSTDPELRSLKHRGIIGAFTIDGDK